MSAAGALGPLAGRVALTAVGLAGVSALLVWAPGAGAQVRQLLGFGFSGPARDPQAALEIAATNLRLVGACLLGAWAVGRRPELRPACDAALGLLLALNAAAVGVALGAYGTRMLQAVALHGPLELAAFAWGGGAYLAARQTRLPAGRLAGAGAAASALALAGAGVETYVQLGGNP